MNLSEALRLIAAKSPNNAQGAIRALRTAQRRPDARPVQYVLEQALVDPLADFTPEERAGVAALLGGDDEARTSDIHLRVSATEKERIQKMADEGGLTVSDFIRERIGL